MNFKEAGDFVTQNALILLGGAWGAAMLAGAAVYVAQHMRPKRPIKHSKEYLKAEADANEAMAKLSLE